MRNDALELTHLYPTTDRVFEVKAVTLASGLTLPYVEQGDPAGVPLILLHGYTDSWRSFAGLLKHLPATFRTIALSQRGHGDAGRPRQGYHPRDFAADLAAFMDAIGIDSAILVGHSMGSQIAQRFAIEHGQRVRGLVLIGAFSSLRDNPIIRELWHSTVAAMTDPIDPAFVRDFQSATLAQPVAMAFLSMVVAESLKLPARIWREALTGQMREDVAGELGGVASPALVIWGDRDALLPERSEQETLAASITGARLVVYPGAGHAVHWEEPALVAADIAAFAGRLAR
jgi:non-heme chloroperoxidase